MRNNQLHLEPDDVKSILAAGVLDGDGQLRVLDAQRYQMLTTTQRALLGHVTAQYCFPTSELIAHLRERIGGRSSLEIGAGAGTLSRELGIPAVDNYMQTWPNIAAHYASLGQPAIRYGRHVERQDANEAVQQRQPQVVVAAWVTHRYRPDRHEAGGNVWGVDEEAILQHCAEYVVIGNEHVHAGKSIWSRPHQIEYPAWLASRAANGSRDFIAVFHGERA